MTMSPILMKVILHEAELLFSHFGEFQMYHVTFLKAMVILNFDFSAVFFNFYIYVNLDHKYHFMFQMFWKTQFYLQKIDFHTSPSFTVVFISGHSKKWVKSAVWSRSSPQI